MANTFVDYTVGAGQTDFAFSFPYLDDTHLVVQLDDSTGSSPGGKFYTVSTGDYSIITSPSALIRFTTAPETGARIRIKRDSASNIALVDFENGSVLTEVELDRAYLHNLYLSEEIEEGSGKNVMTKNSAGNFEADLAKIVDVADPTNPQDAVTKNYADTTFVDVAGDTMTGNLDMGSNKVTSSAVPGTGNDLTNKTYVDGQDALQVTKAGDNMTGDLAMGGNMVSGLGAPISSDHSARKGYVDDQDALQVTKAGDSMSGNLQMNSSSKVIQSESPSSGNDLTNKTYVDAQIATTLATGTAGGPVDTANIADDAITADKLADTAVTPGSYTATNLTVDAQGRITAAANGSASPTAAEVKTLYESNANTNEFDDAEQTKLAGIAAGATANDTDSNLKNRANHTGTQLAATISDLTSSITTVVQSDASGATSAEYTPTVISRSNIDSDPTILQWGYTRVGRIIYLNINIAWNGTGNLGLISSDSNASVKFSVPFLPEARFGSGNYGITWRTELYSVTKTNDDVLSASHFNKTSATVNEVAGTGFVTVNFFNSDTRYAWNAQGTVAYKLDSTVT